MATRPEGQPRFGFGAGAPRTLPTVGLPPSFVDPDYFSPFRRPLDGLNLTRPGAPRTARQIADACRVLPDPSRLPVSPSQLAAQREAIDRAFFMADRPLAGAAYGLATAFGASARGRDAALAAGGTLDAVMQGAAPRGAPIRARPSPPRATPVSPPLALPPIRYRELNSSGVAQGINAILAAPLVPTGRQVPRRLRPPGLQPPEAEFWNARGHLAGDQLGGSRDDPRNFIALTQTPANSPWMRDFENLVARRVRNGEVIDYSVTPFGSAGLPPKMVLMTASSLGRNPAARLVANPARPRR
jgi:hypothetical protein